MTDKNIFTYFIVLCILSDFNTLTFLFYNNLRRLFRYPGVMRYLYGEADEKYVRIMAKSEKKDPLSSFKFRLNSFVQCKTDSRKFNKTDVPVVFKCTPDTLLNLCVKIIDTKTLPVAYNWTIEEVCSWLRDCGFKQYQNTFRENLITGRLLILLDASALSAMNIKDFDHIKDLTRRIRGFFCVAMTEFGQNLNLDPESLDSLYKIYRVKTGKKYDVRYSDVWRKMQIIRQNEPNYSHWEILERRLGLGGQSKCKEMVGCSRKINLSASKRESSKNVVAAKCVQCCPCIPPCQCSTNKLELRPPWRLKCLPSSKPETEFVDICCGCVPPCTCRWPPKMHKTRGVLTCLQKALPKKYGGVHDNIRYRMYDEILSFRLSTLSYS